MQEPESNSKFGGILNGLKKFIFNDIPNEDIPKKEVIESKKNTIDTPPIQNIQPTITVDTNTSISTVDETALVKKIYQLFESINKPGVDFFELWNAVEAMGGPTNINIQNAFTTLKVLGLTKSSLVQSGNDYLKEINEKMNFDIDSNQQEKSTLQSKNNDLENKIASLQKELKDVKDQLAKVDNKYTQPIKNIDDKISVGKNALNIVVKELTTVLNTIETSIK